jgi:hypothetical protein
MAFEELIDVKEHPIFKHQTYSLSVVVDRVLWEEWMLQHFRSVYHHWGNPERMGRINKCQSGPPRR